MMINGTKSKIVGGQSLGQPTFSSTPAERVAIARFLNFALDDIKFQFDKMNNDTRVARAAMKEAQNTAVLLSNYLVGLRTALASSKNSPESATTEK